MNKMELKQRKTVCKLMKVIYKDEFTFFSLSCLPSFFLVLQCIIFSPQPLLINPAFLTKSHTSFTEKLTLERTAWRTSWRRSKGMEEENNKFKKKAKENVKNQCSWKDGKKKNRRRIEKGKWREKRTWGHITSCKESIIILCNKNWIFFLLLGTLVLYPKVDWEDLFVSSIFPFCDISKKMSSLLIFSVPTWPLHLCSFHLRGSSHSWKRAMEQSSERISDYPYHEGLSYS